MSVKQAECQHEIVGFPQMNSVVVRVHILLYCLKKPKTSNNKSGTGWHINADVHANDCIKYLSYVT